DVTVQSPRRHGGIDSSSKGSRHRNTDWIRIRVKGFNVDCYPDTTSCGRRNGEVMNSSGGRRRQLSRNNPRIRPVSGIYRSYLGKPTRVSNCGCPAFISESCHPSKFEVVCLSWCSRGSADRSNTGSSVASGNDRSSPGFVTSKSHNCNSCVNSSVLGKVIKRRFRPPGSLPPNLRMCLVPTGPDCKGRAQLSPSRSSSRSAHTSRSSTCHNSMKSDQQVSCLHANRGGWCSWGTVTACSGRAYDCDRHGPTLNVGVGNSDRSRSHRQSVTRADGLVGAGDRAQERGTFAPKTDLGNSDLTARTLESYRSGDLHRTVGGRAVCNY